MDRRKFIGISSSAAAVACLAPLTVTGCSSPRSSNSRGRYDPGPYTVGSDHVIFDDKGPAYILDVDGHQIIRLNKKGKAVGTFASLGSNPGKLNQPIDATVSENGQLFVLDQGNGRVQVFNSDGQHHDVLADGSPEQGGLFMPRDLAVSGNRLYVSDTLHHRVAVFNMKGKLVGAIGQDSDISSDKDGHLNGPRGLAIDQKGRVHVLDAGDAKVRVFKTDGKPLFKYAGYGKKRGKLLSPTSIASDDQGRIFITDPSHDRVHVFAEDGEFEGRFQPVDERGRPVVAARVSAMPDGRLYIWTNNLASNR